MLCRNTVLVTFIVLSGFVGCIIAKENSLKSFSKCSLSGNLVEIVSCAAGKALKVITEINKKSSIEILPGITYVSDNPKIERDGKDLKDLQLPSDLKSQVLVLFDYLLEETARMVSSRTLRIKLPESTNQSVSRALEEGRGKGKIKKILMPLMLAISAKVFAILPLFIAGVGFLASKALIISKFALGLGLVLMVPSLFGGGGGALYGLGGKLSSLFPGPNYGPPSTGWSTGGGYTPYGYGTNQWTTNQIGGGQYPYARTFNEEQPDVHQDTLTGQDVAYSQYQVK